MHDSFLKPIRCLLVDDEPMARDVIIDISQKYTRLN
jgi:hypothetical protein